MSFLLQGKRLNCCEKPRGVSKLFVIRIIISEVGVLFSLIRKEERDKLRATEDVNFFKVQLLFFFFKFNFVAEAINTRLRYQDVYTKDRLM